MSLRDLYKKLDYVSCGATEKKRMEFGLVCADINIIETKEWN